MYISMPLQKFWQPIATWTKNDPNEKRQRHAHALQTKLPTQESFVVDKGGHSEWSQFEIKVVTPPAQFNYTNGNTGSSNDVISKVGSCLVVFSER